MSFSTAEKVSKIYKIITRHDIRTDLQAYKSVINPYRLLLDALSANSQSTYLLQQALYFQSESYTMFIKVHSSTCIQFTNAVAFIYRNYYY